MRDRGKGDHPRPFSVSNAEYEKNFERVFGKKSEMCYECRGKGVSWNVDEGMPAECIICDGKGYVKKFI